MVDVDQVTSELVVKLGERLLGPTVDIAGQALKSWTRQQVEYVLRVFQKAVLKLGAKIERPGTVPLKILKEVLTEAQFCSDELTSEYLAGVLASSRTELGKDDRGITYLKLTSQLSSY